MATDLRLFMVILLLIAVADTAPKDIVLSVFNGVELIQSVHNYGVINLDETKPLILITHFVAPSILTSQTTELTVR